jgi:hypothetical protein
LHFTNELIQICKTFFSFISYKNSIAKRKCNKKMKEQNRRISIILIYNS